MDVQSLHEHMKGQKILVNGTSYEIGADGIARGVKEDDAKKLLSMAASWRKPVVRSAVPESKTVAPVALEAEKTPPAGEAEWPDPEESMELPFLQQMAKAYDVKFDDKTTKKTLVKRIRDAMYE